ncbi:MAG: lipid-binding SYLF domain-containing protein [Alphaproteobacteria bacterium]
MSRFRVTPVVAVLALAVAAIRPAWAITDQEVLVEKARLTVQTLLADPDYAPLRTSLENAQAVLIVPELLKGGFIIGGQGGNGVLVARDEDGRWGDPAFYLIAGASIGLQIGGQVSELVMAIMTEDGLNAILDHNAKIGADVSAALFTVGAGVGASTGLDTNADMYAFSRNQGLFAGGALGGSVISEKADWNRAYYGAGATGRGVLDGRFSNPHGQALSEALPE